MPDLFRGYPMVCVNGVYLFEDTKEPVSQTWQDRPCGFCDEFNTREGHDACFGRIPGAVNACCGHGVLSEAYIQFPDGRTIRGRDALEYAGSGRSRAGSNSAGSKGVA